MVPWREAEKYERQRYLIDGEVPSLNTSKVLEVLRVSLDTLEFNFPMCKWHNTFLLELYNDRKKWYFYRNKLVAWSLSTSWCLFLLINTSNIKIQIMLFYSQMGEVGYLMNISICQAWYLLMKTWSRRIMTDLSHTE